MISYMKDWLGYLIYNRDIISQVMYYKNQNHIIIISYMLDGLGYYIRGNLSNISKKKIYQIMIT